ncbi:MAG: response regulator [Nitrospinae bacterium]|nr:response regulator [Nitrospinota bacterium]
METKSDTTPGGKPALAFMKPDYWRGATVLVAEDDDIWRHAAGMILRKHGFNVLEAADGGAALKLYEALGHTIDLVLSDILMPQVDGVEFAKINFENRFIPFVICTAVNDPFMSLDALHYGVQDYLVKPAEEHLLINVVVNALARHRFYQEIKENPAFEGNLDRIIIEPRLSEIPRAHAWLFRKLEPRRLANRDKAFVYALYEFLMNAHEHGCLGLGEQLKAELIRSDRYAEELMKRERERRGGRIEVCISLLHDKVAVTVEDDGPGFDFERYLRIGKDGLHERLKQPSGRGIVIASRQFDSVYYGNGGSRVTLIKHLAPPADSRPVSPPQ